MSGKNFKEFVLKVVVYDAAIIKEIQKIKNLDDLAEKMYVFGKKHHYDFTREDVKKVCRENAEFLVKMKSTHLSDEVLKQLVGGSWNSYTHALDNIPPSALSAE